MASYLLTECTDVRNYNVVQCSGQYRENTDYSDVRRVRFTERWKRHGPALVNDSHRSMIANEFSCISAQFFERVSRLISSVDVVFSIRCLSWPSQAADWPTRHRNYDWPDSVTVDRVVSNDCDAVGVAHRRCRHDEWMETVILTSRNCAAKQLDARTADCLSHVTIFREDNDLQILFLGITPEPRYLATTTLNPDAMGL